MGVDLRLPNIHGSDREQLVQMRSYLYQLVGELQWALNNVSVGSQSVVVQTRSGATVPSASHSSDIETTFSALKPLIIKSADIARAYYEEIDSLLSLEGSYVAESDFGKFVQETGLKVSANSTSITQNYKNYQSIETDIGKVKNDLSSETVARENAFKSVEAYIKMGLLDNVDGTDVYGVEIKQVDGIGTETVNKSARFTAGMLSLYDAQGKQRVVIEDQTCKMPSVEIKDNAKLGKFMLDFEGGVRLKWVGK